MDKKMDIDSWRKFHLGIAEFIDAWRIIPRAVVLLFGYGVYGVTNWYMNLEPYIIEGCIDAGGKIAECIVQSPTTQHTALVSAMFALAAAVFAFYSNNGRKWDRFVHWNQPTITDTPESLYYRKGDDTPVANERSAPRPPDVDTVTVKSRGILDKGGNGG